MGGEKPMDTAFINGILRSTSLPPIDPWLSGYQINYYYFGQFITATLVKLTHIPTSIMYNLFISFLFAQAAAGAFCIASTFIKSKFTSLLGSIFLLVSGNLAQLSVIYVAIVSYQPINGWYWTASRVMPNNEINEFPFFSFLYADLHSHLIALPIVLLFIAVIIEAVYRIRENHVLKSVYLLLFGSLILGIIRITNIWDYPTYLLMALSAIFFTIIFSKYSLIKKGVLMSGASFFLVIGSAIAIAPFLLNFRTGPLGLDIYNGPKTTISDYLLIHGLFISVILTFLIISIKPNIILSLSKLKRLIIYLPFAFMLVFLTLGFYFLSFISLLILISFLALITNPKEKFIAPIFFFIFALMLTVIPDLIDIKLGLGRMNTVFKFYFQAWIFYAISAGISIYYIYESIKNRVIKFPILILLALIFTTTLLYPLTSTPAKINDRMTTDRTPTLNGMHYMKNSFYYDASQVISLKEDLEAINWINSNIKGAPVIVEANTPIYRWGARVSIYTGLPTILGWDWHEIAHRQYLPEWEIRQRSIDIQNIYESREFNTTKKLLLRYNVSYIYLGQLEKAYYDTQGIEELIFNNPNFFTQIYDNPNVKIYKLLNGKSDQG